MRPAPTELPAYLDYREGGSPVVIVAPHGGRRSRDVKRSDGINDVHTAELSHSLAARLGAFALVNARLDRNDTDLNRISEISERAPGLAAWLRHAVDAAELSAGRGVVPLVLWVHGWNVSSAACDIGIGLREVEGAPRGAHPTVGAATYERFVVPLRRALEARGIGGFLGHRYPASGRDNATQIFSGRHIGHDNRDIDALSRRALAGRADAVQLELSIALRFDGPYRGRWLDAVEEAVVGYLSSDAPTTRSSRAGSESRGVASATESRGWSEGAAARRGRESVVAAGRADVSADGETVQCVLADGSGLFLGVEPTSATGLAARICVARPQGELALLVCEAPWSGRVDRFEAGALRWEPGRRVRYAGPAVVYASHEAFADLERGLRSAALTELEVDIEVADSGKSAEKLSGFVRIGKASVELCGPSQRRGGGRFVGGAGVRRRVVLREEDGRIVVIEERDGDREAGEGGPAEDARAGRSADSEAARAEAAAGLIDVADDIESLTVHSDALGTTWAGRAIVRVPVYRPAPGGGFVKVVFGVVEWESRRGGASHMARGLFEVVERFPPRPR